MAETNKDKYTKVSEVADKYYGGAGKKGTYEEGTGGGTSMGPSPFSPDKNKNLQGRGAMQKADSDTTNNRYSNEQPRTDDGKFTYNSVNGKDTKYEGRGKTVPPTLTGGKNGIYIDEEVADEKGKMSARDFYKGENYIPFEKGDKIAFKGKVKTLTVGQFQIAQGYGENMTAGKFIDESYEKIMKSRGVGRYSKQEKAAAKASEKAKTPVGVAAKEDEGRAKDVKYMESEKAKEEAEAKAKEETKAKSEQRKAEKEKYASEDEDKKEEKKEFTLSDVNDDNLADKEAELTERFTNIDDWYDYSDEHEDEVDNFMEKLANVWDISISEAYDRVENKIKGSK